MDEPRNGNARRWVKQAGVTFQAALDDLQGAGGLWKLYGFKAIPSGFLVDEQGILRYAKIGQFDVRNPRDAGAISEILAQPAPCPAVLSTPACGFFQSINLGAWRDYPQ